MSDFFDLADTHREQSLLARDHARYSEQEPSYQVTWLLLMLAAVLVTIWGLA